MHPTSHLLASLVVLAASLAPAPAAAQTLVAGHGGEAAARAALQDLGTGAGSGPRRPAGVEVSAASLAAAAQLSERLAGRALLVLEEGEIVFERYADDWSADRPHPLASGTKSFNGVLAAIAVHDGLFASLDEPVAAHVAAWREDAAKRTVRLRHLLELSSGLAPAHTALGPRGYGIENLAPSSARTRHFVPDDAPPSDRFAAAVQDVPLVAEPGAEFAYGPSHLFAFGAALEAALADSEREETSYFAYLEARVLAPARIDASLERFAPDAAGKPGAAAGAHLTAREWARFGRWVQLGGTLAESGRGAQDREFARDVFAPLFEPSDTNRNYGLSWWLSSRDVDAEPGAGGGGSDATLGLVLDADGIPIRVAMAAGLGRQRLYLIEALDLVVVRFAEHVPEGRPFDDVVFLRTLLGL